MRPTVLALTLSALAVAAAAAQGPTDPGSPIGLLSREKVRRELKLTDAQSAAVKKAVASLESDPKTAFQTIFKTLEPAQQRRLKEISYQVRGGAAVGDGDVMKALGLSDKQKGEVRSIWANAEKDLQMKLAVARFRSPQARQKFIAEHRKGAGERLLAVLTDAQKKAFDKLKGRPFDAAALDSD